MCKYCTPVEETEYFILCPEKDDEYTDILYKKETKEHILRQGRMGHHHTIIKYCPFCGRKLEGKEC